MATPDIALQTFTAYQSETPKKPSRMPKVIQPAVESVDFSFLSGGVSIFLPQS